MVKTFRAVSMLAIVAMAAGLRADDDKKDLDVSLSDGRLHMTAPKAWEKKTPRVRIIEYEFAAAAKEEGETPARITIMGAGGGVEANIDRWVGQFSQPDGKPTKERTKIEKLKISEQPVYIVDIVGTYEDRPSGPFAGGPVKNLPGYRMLSAIVATEKRGHYYVKMYGPSSVVEKHAKAFRAMIDSLRVE